MPSSLTMTLHMARATAASVPGMMGTHSVALPPAKLQMGSKTPQLHASGPRLGGEPRGDGGRMAGAMSLGGAKEDDVIAILKIRGHRPGAMHNAGGHMRPIPAMERAAAGP